MRRNSASNKTFRDLEQQLMSLYRAKEHQQAFELVEREHLNFPDQQRQIAPAWITRILRTLPRW